MALAAAFWDALCSPADMAPFCAPDGITPFCMAGGWSPFCGPLADDCRCATLSPISNRNDNPTRTNLLGLIDPFSSMMFSERRARTALWVQWQFTQNTLVPRHLPLRQPHTDPESPSTVLRDLSPRVDPAIAATGTIPRAKAAL